MTLASKQKYRPVEQDKKSRDEPMPLWSPNLWQMEQAGINNEENNICSINGGGYSGNVHVTEWNKNTP